MAKILLVVIVAGTIIACQSAQDKAAKSQEAETGKGSNSTINTKGKELRNEML